MKIADLMMKNVFTCKPEESLAEAAAVMLKQDIGSLPVVDSADMLVGMITDRDICMSGLIEGRPLKDLPVSLAASHPAWACAAEDSLDKVHTTMQEHAVHRLPVLDKEKKLVGIIGLSDLVRATMDKKAGLTPNELTKTIAAITKPRERKSSKKETSKV